MKTLIQVGGVKNTSVEKYIVDTKSELPNNPKIHTMALVLVDETNHNKPNSYIYSGSAGAWVPVNITMIKSFEEM